MAFRLRCIGLVVCVLAARRVAAQDIHGKMFGADSLWSCMKKDTIHGHLQRMLQVETESEEPESLESCSPAALTQSDKCMAKPATDSRLTGNPSISLTSGPTCKGVDCLVAPMPSEKAPIGGKSVAPDVQSPALRATALGPMTQEAFERMAQRKRASLRAQLQKAGLMTPELDAFLRGVKGSQVKDAFGIPLPVGSKVPRPNADFEMRFPPQAPAPAPDTVATTASAATTTTTASATTTSATASAPSDDFEMRFAPQTPAPDPNLIRKELEAFIAATPAPQYATVDEATERTADPAPPQQQDSKPAREDDVGAPGGPARPPMTEHEASRIAAQQAAREAALTRKRQMVREEPTTAPSKKANRTSVMTTNTTVAVSPGPRGSSASRQQQQPADQRLRAAGFPATTASTAAKGAKRAVAAETSAPVAASSAFGMLGYLLVVVLVVASAVGLFMAAAVMENAVLDRPSSNWKAGGSGDVLALTRGLWRRCRRAFSAARKQLTGHGSDLPLSANEGAGPLARAVAAASAFVHVFWTYLAADSSLRGAPLHIGEAVAAAIDASRRASAGGTVAPDRSSAGGAAPSSSPSYYASTASPFAAPQYQRRRA